MSTFTIPISASVNRRGISLLEVLVACGLLVIALASIAALLPAAGTRLSQASLADRSGMLAANAYAEVMNRGLLSSALYSGTTAAGTSIAAPPTTYAFGRMMDRIVISNASATAKGKGPGKKAGVTETALPGLAAPQENMLYRLIDFDRGFSLEDELELQAATIGEVPLSLFTNGYRSFRDALCWGAMLSVAGPSVAPGAPAELSIAIFKKEGSVSTDTDVDNGVPITLNGPFPLYTLDEAARQTYLQSCSYVLALPPPTSGLLPRWAKVIASWPSNAATGPGSVVLEVDGEYAATPSLQVVGFQTIVRVDTYSVVLE